MLKNIATRTITVAAICLASALALGTSSANADDSMGQQRRRTDSMKMNMGKMKTMLQEPNAMPAITSFMTKLHAMDELAAEMAKDPE
jgi:hypothetical protein